MSKYRRFTAVDYQRFLDQGPTVLEVIMEKYPGFSDIIEPLLVTVRKVLAGEATAVASPDDEIYQGWERLSNRMAKVLIPINPVGVVGDVSDPEDISDVV